MFEPMHNRYPGALPFSDDELSARLFFGREQEVVTLTHQIIANRLVVLFARSGLGKTSLINAGIAGKLRSQGFLPLSVRVNDVELGPLASIYRGIEEACRSQKIEYVPGKQESLWHFFKTAQFWSSDVLMTPVLVLDQFEELFTLQTAEKIDSFLNEFSFLARGISPPTSDTMSPLGAKAPNIRILISIREDFLANLEEISDRVPGILDKRFRLLPMGREMATHALESPANLEDASLSTAPFSIHEDAREAILELLDRRRKPGMRADTEAIEPFQLQLICQRIEEIAKIAQSKMHGNSEAITVSLANIGGKSKLCKILGNFYKNRVAAVPSWLQRRKVIRMCSEFLITPSGRRLRREESEIVRLTGVKENTLKILVDQRLLRREYTADGDYYELSHDSLVAPVLDSVRTRFLVRAVLGVPLLIAGMLIVATIVTGMFGMFFLKEEKWEENIAFLVFCFFIIYITFRMAIGKYRTIRELWRRSRA